jgi:hypothetical protein
MGLLREVVVVGPAVLMVYFGARQEGPWLWVAQVQLWLLKSYLPSLGFIVCLLLTMFAMAALHAGLLKAGWPPRLVLGRLLWWFLSAWTTLPTWLGMLSLLGAIVLGIGLWSWLPVQWAGLRTEVSAEDLEAGERPGSRWLVVSGQALVERGVSWGKRGSTDERAVCFVSPRWRNGEPVAVVLSASSSGSVGLPAHSGPTTVEGVAKVLGVPGLMRSSFEKQGLRLADQVIYLEVGRAPGRMGLEGWLAAVGGGVVLFVVLVGLLWWAWNRRVGTPPEPIIPE